MVAILTWGGLRGGISVAMALAVPDGEYRDVIVSVTYIVVVFSILVQGGPTLGTVVRVIGSRANLEFNSCAPVPGGCGRPLSRLGRLAASPGNSNI